MRMLQIPGSLKVLFGLIKLDNPLTLLQAVYPTEKNTAVYGPLRGLDTDTWNKWVGAVGLMEVTVIYYRHLVKSMIRIS